MLLPTLPAGELRQVRRGDVHPHQRQRTHFDLDESGSRPPPFGQPLRVGVCVCVDDVCVARNQQFIYVIVLLWTVVSRAQCEYSIRSALFSATLRLASDSSQHKKSPRCTTPFVQLGVIDQHHNEVSFCAQVKSKRKPCVDASSSSFAQHPSLWFFHQNSVWSFSKLYLGCSATFYL